MRTLRLSVLTATVFLALALALGACGNGGAAKTKGGTLKVLSNEGFEHLDPGSTYFQLDYEVVYSVQRPLYAFEPDNTTQASPDLADGQPTVSANKKTVTVKIKPNIHYNAHVSRPVTSADVKYAIERGFSPTVANGYAGSYFGDLVGADKAKGGPINGIETRDNQTIVFKLTKPFGATFVQALSMPLTAPVPKEYAAKFDKSSPSKYDSDPTIQAFTGPYVISSYAAGRSLTLARNPKWDASTDIRPAYVDSVQWQIGADPNVAGRQILSGRDQINGDTPPAPIVKEAVQKYNSQVNFTPYGNRYVGLNNAIPPFNDANVRKAVNAVMNRTALQLTRGGKLAGDIATHIDPPTAPGFDQAGGFKGTGADFLANPNGDLNLAESYMKKAGFKSGQYSGPPIFVVGSTEDPADKTAQVVVDGLRKLGFKLNFRSVPQDTMYSRFCNVPKQKVQVCPNVGWLPDFNDGYAYLYVPFDGKAITQLNNSNWPQLNDPKVNDLIRKGTDATSPADRAKFFGAADKAITDTAAVVPWFWDKQPNIKSKNVDGTIDKWNASWDLSYTAVK